MPNAYDIVIAGLVIPYAAAQQISQSYETIGGRARLRFADGSGLQQTVWTRTRTVISGVGRLPDGLAGVDWDSPVEIQCLAPLAIRAAGNVITLPAARRAAPAPMGHAIVNGRLVPTGLALAGDDATLVAVAGATGYQATYWPVLTCLADPPSRDFDGRGIECRWTLTAEEV